MESSRTVEKVRRFIRAQGLVTRGDRVLLAVSGGKDSMAMLHIMCGLREEGDFIPAACYVDHGLRKAAEREALFVRKAAGKRGIQFVLEKIDVVAAARKEGCSIEEGGRKERYAVLRKLALKLGYGKVATAHTMTDQAETVLMRLLRGSGMSGAAAILSSIDGGIIIRPLLRLSALETRDYCVSEGIEWIEDETNSDPSFVRNRIRMDLLPLLKERFNPRAEEALSRFAEICLLEDRFIEAETEKAFERTGTSRGGGIAAAKVEDVLALHPALQLRLIRRMVKEAKGDLRRIGRSHPEAVRSILDKKEGSSEVSLPGSVRAERRYGELVVAVERSRAPFFLKKVVDLEVPGEGVFGPEKTGVTIKVERRRTGGGDEPHAAADRAVFDAEKISFPLRLRTRRKGDFIRLRGVGRKKISNFFVDAKVPRTERDKVLLLASGSEVLWIVGMRLSEAAAAGGETRETVCVEVRIKGGIWPQTLTWS